MAINGNATVDIDGSVFVSAQGFGGSAGECSICDVTGGNGTGGNASVHTNVGSGNTMTIGSDVTVTAAGFGGAGDAQAGTGRGGIANLGASDSSSLTVAADTEVDASGFGGFGFDNVGGLGRGGTARIGTDTNGSIDLTGPGVRHRPRSGRRWRQWRRRHRRLCPDRRFPRHHPRLQQRVGKRQQRRRLRQCDGGTGGAGLADIETAVTPAMTEASLIASGGTLTVDGLAIVSANATGGDGGFNGGDGGDAVAAGIAGTINGGAIVHAANSDFGPSVIQLGDVTVTAEAQGGARRQWLGRHERQRWRQWRLGDGRQGDRHRRSRQRRPDRGRNRRLRIGHGRRWRRRRRWRWRQSAAMRGDGGERHWRLHQCRHRKRQSSISRRAPTTGRRLTTIDHCTDHRHRRQWRRWRLWRYCRPGRRRRRRHWRRTVCCWCGDRCQRR